MNDFIMWLVLFAIIYWFFTRHDRKDRERWPSLMSEEDYLRKQGTPAAKKCANTMRKMRKKARTDKRMAEELDREDNMAWRAKMEVDKQGDMDRMRNTIDEMDRKIKDLEFENLRNRRY